ncbi:MAG: hypothetical protein GY783_04625 [Gammaproteobacteria bacterium]|nr:hypothetical protein [Gammaproteobacteria bacterium]
MSNDQQMTDLSPQRLEAFRFVAEWAWSNGVFPSEIHDAAALALDRPSLAHGYYSNSVQPDGGHLTDERSTKE